MATEHVSDFKYCHKKLWLEKLGSSQPYTCFIICYY